MNFRLVVFDWDGTLMDSVARIVDSMQRALIELGCPPKTTQQIQAIIGLGLPETMQILLPEADASLHNEVAIRYRANYALANQVSSNLFPGAKTVVEELAQRGYLLAIATAKSRGGLDAVLHETGLKNLFNTSRCVGETLSKPHPEMLLQIIDELKVKPQDTVMIGDTEHDLELAANAGVQALAVCYGAHSREQLLRHFPLACFDHVQEIPDWLARFG